MLEKYHRLIFRVLIVVLLVLYGWFVHMFFLYYTGIYIFFMYNTIVRKIYHIDIVINTLLYIGLLYYLGNYYILGYQSFRYLSTAKKVFYRALFYFFSLGFYFLIFFREFRRSYLFIGIFMLFSLLYTQMSYLYYKKKIPYHN